MTYTVFDLRTKQIIGIYKNLKAARRKADALDLAYGCINYGVRRSEPNGY